ncbi:MAG: hypothetical protein IPJ61_13775 [Tessaracoccus sp.]|uniref:hypothetical protein n=1 Tax=Tessaracoccus sp. TaxID=1971211 RepID=UPI001EBD4F0C|nr:hypothetical protein [Tessaracoccus sp.]MBK7822095.1 hypothetical protein [Tessaracoccus sp.]
MGVDWMAFAKVFAAACIGAVSIVAFYALGTRMVVRGGWLALTLASVCFTLCAAAVVLGLVVILI